MSYHVICPCVSRCWFDIILHYIVSCVLLLLLILSLLLLGPLRDAAPAGLAALLRDSLEVGLRGPAGRPLRGALHLGDRAM